MQIYISVNAIRERELPEEIHFAGYVQRRNKQKKEKKKKLIARARVLKTKMSLQRGKLIENRLLQNDFEN